MFKSIFKIAGRNLWKHKFFSAINIAGLSAGLSCCLLIGLYVQHELSFDNFHKKGNRISRVIMEYSFGEEPQKGNYTSTKVAPAFSRNFPEVEAAVRIAPGSEIVKYEDKLFNEKNFIYADSTFFSIFSYSFLRGNPATALNGPDKVVITKSMAKKYFGDADPIGKNLIVDIENKPFLITGLVDDAPSNSQVYFDFVASFSSLGVSQEQTYFNANYTTYLLFKDGIDQALMQKKITAFMKKEVPEENGSYITFWLEPLKSVHLHSPYDGMVPNNNISYIYIIIAVALLILIIACFTYINLATARSLERAKEVGLRKTIGAQKNQIFWQFIGESSSISFIAVILSVIIVAFTLPAFNQLSGKTLALSSLFTPATAAISVLFICCISLLAGSYPALILSKFQPISVLKGKFKNTGSGILIRKSLVVFQFSITVFLIAATLIITNQLKYIQEKKLGYNRDHILVLPMDGNIMKNLDAIKTEMKTIAGVRSLSAASFTPVAIHGGYSMRKPEMSENANIAVKANPVDEDFIKTSDLKLIAGTDFIKQDIIDADKSDQDSAVFHFILNESAAAKLGYTAEQAINKPLVMGGRKGFIKGVLKDFHFQSLHIPIGALVLFPANWTRHLMIKTESGNITQTISALESKWKKLVPHRPFEYRFLDDDYQKMYNSEIRLGKVLKIFSGLAILLACLGLVGLSSYSAQQRIKEIGIRKVMGASVLNIVNLLSKDFILLAIIAIVIAIPVAWWATHNWLADFTYRITVGWWIFAVAGITAVLITLLSVSFQAIRAALINPVKSLKSE